MADRIFDQDPDLHAEAETERRRHEKQKLNGGGPGGPGGRTDGWSDPDMGVLGMHRRPPPALPIDTFGSKWDDWITQASEAAAGPPDYVAAPLLASVSALIGHARWAQATLSWAEPPHLWCSVVGDSGDGKSPDADCLMRYVLPQMHRCGSAFDATARTHNPGNRVRCGLSARGESHERTRL